MLSVLWPDASATSTSLTLSARDRTTKQRRRSCQWKSLILASIGTSSNHIRGLCIGSPALDADQPKPANDKAWDIDSDRGGYSLRQREQCREGRERTRVRTRQGQEA
jgi:hypothetical protein